jgi:hypothetical protein
LNSGQGKGLGRRVPPPSLAEQAESCRVELELSWSRVAAGSARNWGKLSRRHGFGAELSRRHGFGAEPDSAVVNGWIQKNTRWLLSVLSEAEEYGRRGNESSTRHLAERMEKLAARAPRAMGHGRKGASGCRAP